MRSQNALVIRGVGTVEDKFVSGAMNRQKKSRIRRIGFEVLPQTKHMVVNGPAGWIILVAPNLV